MIPPWLTGLTLALAPGAGPGGAALPETLQVQSLWDFVVKGGVMMIPIGLCSCIALTVVVERLTSLRRRRVIPPDFLEGLQKVMRVTPDDPAPAIAYCRDDGSPVARVFAAGLRRVTAPIGVLERHVQDAGQREVFVLRRSLRVLSVIAAVTPLLGLLGTIFGMISAFQTVATSADALGRTELLAGGIYEAMITTAGGLVVAIPTLVAYHWLSAKVQTLVLDIDQMTVGFLEDITEQRRGPLASPDLRRHRAQPRAPFADERGATMPDEHDARQRTGPAGAPPWLASVRADDDPSDERPHRERGTVPTRDR